MNKQELGKLISKYRKLSGMTQKELSEKIGISAPCMSNIERGINYPDIDNFFAIVEGLNISLDSLLKQESDLAQLFLNDKPYRDKFNELSSHDKDTVLHLIDDLWKRKD